MYQPKFFLVPLMAIIVAISAFRTLQVTYNQTALVTEQADVESKEIISCGPAGDSSPPFDEAGRKMVPLPGWGRHQWKITTVSDSAQFYFNQGLNLYYSFHMSESKASFQEAQRHDPNSAMTYWGYALSVGPFINNTEYDFNDRMAIDGLEKALTLTQNPLEKDLIKAQQTRFTVEKKISRKQLAIDYSNAMQEIYEQHPDNMEIGTLYADAMMQVNARDWYGPKSQPKQGTEEIVQLLEKILIKEPAHPAALHYYIHMVEPSTTPERARDEADRLMPLMPSVAHMIHMPSHIYIRTGDYQKGVLSNQLAIAGYYQYKNTIKNGWEGNRNTYLYHNADMQGTNAMMAGNYSAARKAFRQNVDFFNKADTANFGRAGLGNYMQFLTAQSYLLLVRFGKWKEIINVKQPISKYTFHQVLWQFGQGMAKAKTNEIKGAKDALAFIEAKLRNSEPSLLTRRFNGSRYIDVVNVMKHILEGTIAIAEKRTTEAIETFSAAVEAEDTLSYAEPELWRLPARHYLGQAYLISGDYKKAQQTFESDLKDHPFNFWALNGLKVVLKSQKKISDVKRLEEEKYKQVFTIADVKLYGAVY